MGERKDLRSGKGMGRSVLWEALFLGFEGK